MSGNNTIETVWTEDEVGALTQVTDGFRLTAEESQKLSTQVLSYIAGLGGCTPIR